MSQKRIKQNGLLSILAQVFINVSYFGSNKMVGSTGPPKIQIYKNMVPIVTPDTKSGLRGAKETMGLWWYLKFIHDFLYNGMNMAVLVGYTMSFQMLVTFFR